jgi:vancomycin resistance protein YoaR
VVLVLALVLLFGGAYVAAYATAGDKVPVGTTVAGVAVGGRSQSSAVRALRDGLAARVDRPFTVIVNGRTQQVSPADVGLAVDYAASIRKAGAHRSWRPSRLWAYYTSGTAFQPVVTLDQDRLGALLLRLDRSAGREPRNGSVLFGRQAFTVRPPRPGLVLDPREAGTAFWNAFLTDDPSVQLRMSETTPMVDAGAVHRFVRRFANPAMSAAVELRFGPATLHLPPGSYGRFLGARRFGHQLRPTVHARGLAHLAERQLAGADIDRPVPASVALVDGRPQVVGAQPGVAYRPHAIAAALLRAITSRQRAARVRSTAANASFTGADALGLGIRSRISRFTLLLPRGRHDDALATAAHRLDGVVLKPRRALSLRGLLGPSTPEGTSGQALATALFNAAWLGGMRVTAHATSTSYAGDAPLGRDASLRDGQDVAFTDNTPYGVLVSAVAAPPTPTHHGSLTVTLWSTPRWVIRSSHGDRTDVVPAGRDVHRGKGCTARDGRDGFTVTVTRAFARGGAVDHTSAYTAHYAPVDEIVCKRRR